MVEDSAPFPLSILAIFPKMPLLPCSASCMRQGGGGGPSGGRAPTVPGGRDGGGDGEAQKVGQPELRLDAVAAAGAKGEVAPVVVAVEVRHVLHRRHARHLRRHPGGVLEFRIAWAGVLLGDQPGFWSCAAAAEGFCLRLFWTAR